MKLRYIGEDGNLKIGGRGLKNGEVVTGDEGLAERGDFEKIKEIDEEETNEEEMKEETD